MKKTNSFIIFLVLVSLTFLYWGCDTRQETKQPVACFSYIPTDVIYAGDEVTFTSCSTDAESFSWNFDDGSTSIAENPKHTFAEPGSYTVVLLVTNKNLRNQTEKIITVEANIDPYDYNGIPGWNTLYFEDFSASTSDWWEGTGSTYQAYIYGGFYTFIDTDPSEANFGRYYYTDSYTLPTGNYDYEASIRNTVDNGNYGSGLAFGIASNVGYNYFKFTTYNNLGYYNIGNSNATWSGWATTADANLNDFNKLTVRKYENKYYFFINEVFLYSDDYSHFGDLFGFIIDKDTQVDIDAVGLFEMDLSSKKAAKPKQLSNVAGNGKGGGTIGLKTNIQLTK